MNLIDRYRGSMLGLAAGDALGTTLEFTGDERETVTTIVGGGPYDLEPGQWTDDTSMALCLAASLTECGGFDPRDQMERYSRWSREDYMSSTGECFDIGTTVINSLIDFEKTGDPYPNKNPRDAGNGSLMRLAPIPLYFASDPVVAIENAALMSLTTHGSKEASDACRYYTGLIIGALEGRSKDELLGKAFSPVGGTWKKDELEPKIAAIARGSFKRVEPPVVRTSGGYVVPSLKIALWAFYNTSNFRDGALMAVNVGHDADTYGAIYGQLAGAYYGESGIPEEWRRIIAKRELIVGLAEGLMARPSQR
jgi:ADP-ribosylglycohydrolase